MALDNLAPPGSSSYTSATMHVGDGTWDKTTDTFLLPNLQGLNFATMRYNGMANRFKDQPEYHSLILGHGVVAAIAFVLIMPLTSIMARFGADWPGGRISFKTHVYAQIIIVFLSTIVIVLGWFAVGPQRSLSNPHHGIGLAIYVLILFQFLYATCWFRKERRRTVPPVRLPLTVFLHRLLGRATGVLAFIEVGLGLTLYGSPKYLFVLYSLIGAFYLVVYLSLYYHYLPHHDGSRPGRAQRSEYYSEYGSAISGSAIPPQQRKDRHWGRDLLEAGGMVGAYEWYRNKRDKRRDARDEKYGHGPDRRYGAPSEGGPPYGPVQGDGAHLGPSSVGAPPIASVAAARRPMSQSGFSRDSWEDDKYSARRERPTFGTRVMEATGAFAAYEGMRSFFNRRRGRREHDDYEDGSYGSALGGNRPIQSDVSRVQAGDAPMSPDTPRVDMAGGPQPVTPTLTPSRPPRNATFAAAALSEDDNRDGYDPRRPRPLLEDGAPLSEHVRELGPIAGVREWNRQRKARREADRAENVRRQELENEESFNRRNSNHYPRPQDASNRMMSNSGTLMTGPSALGNSEMSRVRPDTSHPPLPAEAGYSLPPPPPGPPPATLRSDGYGSQPTFGSAQMPSGAVNPDPNRLLRDNTAANESSAYGRDPRVRDDVVGAAAAGAVAGVASNALRDRSRGQSHSPSRGQDSRNRLPRQSRRGSATTASISNSGPLGPSNPNSPPVSVQVKMHNDGRHVTLRRLNDEEAAAGRQARRQDRQRRRASSLSSEGEGAGAGPPLGQRYRRDNAAVRSSSQQPITNVPPPPAMSSSAGVYSRQQSQQTLPPAPPAGPAGPPQASPASNQALSPPTAPVAGSGMGYATDQGTGTDVSAFADNRRRRRAERARRQEAARQGGEFD